MLGNHWQLIWTSAVPWNSFNNCSNSGGRCALSPIALADIYLELSGWDAHCMFNWHKISVRIWSEQNGIRFYLINIIETSYLRLFLWCASYCILIGLLRYIHSILQFVSDILYQNSLIDVLMDEFMSTIPILHILMRVWDVYHYVNVIQINMCKPVTMDVWTLFYVILGYFTVNNSDWFEVFGCRTIAFGQLWLGMGNWIYGSDMVMDSTI